MEPLTEDKHWKKVSSWKVLLKDTELQRCQTLKEQGSKKV